MADDSFLKAKVNAIWLAPPLLRWEKIDLFIDTFFT